MSRHTPGSLSVRSSYTGSGYTHVCSPSDDRVAVVRLPEDARLFVAAPDLLAALADCVEHMEWSDKYGRAARDKALIAIAKAKGEQS